MADDADVIHLFGAPPAVDGAPETSGFAVGCYPHWPTVDKDSRTVACRRCKRALDPVDVLLEVASRHQQWQRLQDEVSTMRSNLAALREEEKRVKARTKSHSRKDAEQAVADERLRTVSVRAEVLRRTRDVRDCLKRIEQLMGKASVAND